MRSNPTILHPALPLAVAVVLALGTGFPGRTVVHAQTPAAADPPSRVGRTALLLGTVSFHTADQADWGVAVLNYPVTSGNAFWTQPSSAAAIDVDSTHLALDQSTEFNIDTLDDHNFQATEKQGAIFLRLRNVPPGDVYSITTPRGVAVITQAGAYEIVAGDAGHPTTVTVLEGSARIDSTNASLTLTARQTGRIDGASNFAASVVPAVLDAFVTARLAEEQRIARAPQPQSSAPPVVARMTGGYALDRVGSWAPSPEYGRIWYPPVAATWVPYRDGHWGYVAPWGWTWIDDSSWGFAPFHYGRWVREGTRWGWIPAERAEQERREAPVYAPALVTFLSIGIAVGSGQRDPRGRDPQGSVGWIPLGPRETYVPPYQASDRYVRDVNSNNVTTTTNVTSITNVTTVNNYVNRSAATMVPTAAMTTSQQIAARAEPVNAQVLAAARAERAAPVQPTAATLGVTPVVARQLNLQPAPAAAQPAPGPALPPPAAVSAVQPAPARPGVAALPVAAALPVLRPPTAVAPAHPQAGGTVVGAPVGPPGPLPPTQPAGAPTVPPTVVPAVPPLVAPRPGTVPGVPAPPALVAPPPIGPPGATTVPPAVVPPVPPSVAPRPGPVPGVTAPPAVVAPPPNGPTGATKVPPAGVPAVPPLVAPPPILPPRAVAPAPAQISPPPAPAPAVAAPPAPAATPVAPPRPPAPPVAPPTAPVLAPVAPPRPAAPPVAPPTAPVLAPVAPPRPAAPPVAPPPAPVPAPVAPPRPAAPPVAPPPAPAAAPVAPPRPAPPPVAPPPAPVPAPVAPSRPAAPPVAPPPAPAAAPVAPPPAPAPAPPPRPAVAAPVPVPPPAKPADERLKEPGKP